MKRVRYNKMGLNPHSRKWEIVSNKATLLTEEEAEILNWDSKKTGIKYEIAKKTTAKK